MARRSSQHSLITNIATPSSLHPVIITRLEVEPIHVFKMDEIEEEYRRGLLTEKGYKLKKIITEDVARRR